jgi:phosphatidylglycerophosphate synthase
MFLKTEYLTVPNGLSVSRIILMPLLFLFLFTDHHLLFLMFYIILGSTDLFDGLIARNFDLKSEIGKTLDSVGDLIFYLGSLIFIYILFPHVVYNNSLPLILFFIIFSLSFIVSWIKLGKPILMHTSLLRLNAVLVYFLVIFSFMFDTSIFGTIIIFIYYIAFTEEIAIFLMFDEFDRDAKSLIHLIKDRDSRKN